MANTEAGSTRRMEHIMNTYTYCNTFLIFSSQGAIELEVDVPDIEVSLDDDAVEL